MSLNLKHRPETLEDFVGNEAGIEALTTMLDREPQDRKQVYLFVGKAGVGKTTLARIVKSMIGCSDFDYYEYDAANTGGVDFARAIKEKAYYQPTDGKFKVMTFDECFGIGTMIRTSIGSVPIEEINGGDWVESIDGFSKVSQTFENKVSLQRIVRVNTSDKPIFCSEDHLFLTPTGWVRAKDLKNNLLFRSFSDNMLLISSLKGENNVDQTEALSYLPRELFTKSTQPKVLRQLQKTTMGAMRMVFQPLLSKRNPFSILLPKLCSKMEQQSARDERNAEEQRTPGIDKEGKTSIHANNPIQRAVQGFLGKNEEKQPNATRIQYPKNVSHKKIEWNFAHLARAAWGKWKAHYSPTLAFVGIGLGDGSGCIIDETRTGISHKLQNRHSEHISKNRCGDRWRWTQQETSYIERQKERGETDRTRVESVEVYQPGSNDESFQSIVGDKERTKGFVKFYDLEIEGHPSYYAENTLVHNCHKLTTHAQDALLKILEEPPAHAYFCLCTTEPEKILATIKRRCHITALHPLPSPTMVSYLKSIVEKEFEEIDLDEMAPILTRINKASEGSPGVAIGLLDSVIDIEEEETALQAIEDIVVSEATVGDICKTLLDKNQVNKWEIIRKKLQRFQGDPEQSRYAILGWMNTVLLSDYPNPLSELIIPFFTDSFMYMSEAGLTIALRECCKVLDGK